MVWEQRAAPPNMALQRTRRLASLGSPLNAQPLAPTAKGSQKEVVWFLITQDHIAFLPAAPEVYS